MVRNVSGLEEGVYHYDRDAHRLHVIEKTEIRYADCFHDPDPIKVEGDASGSGTLDGTCVAVVLASSMKKSYYKYGDRSWKLMLLEAGHIGQNICLVSAAMSRLGLCPLGGMNHQILCDALHLVGYSEMPIYPLLLGRI